MIPEIQSETDRIFCPYGSFFALLPSNNLENQNFEKMRKASGDIIFLNMCTKNYNHMTYAFWDMECHRNIIYICHLGYFLHFYPTTDL